MEFSEKFNAALDFVFENEGGFSNNPFDRGGPTNLGITQETLAKFRGRPVSEDDIRNLTSNEAMKIYHAFYWAPLALDQVVFSALCIMFFDQAVNRGVVTVARQMQNLVGVKEDGLVGPVTIAAINSKEPYALGIQFFKKTQLSYAQIIRRAPDQAVFLYGWLARTHRLLGLLI